MKRRRSARISVQQPLKRKRNLARAATNKQKIEDETSEEIEEVAIDSSNQTECPFDTDEEALIGRFPVIQQRDWKQQEAVLAQMLEDSEVRSIGNSLFVLADDRPSLHRFIQSIQMPAKARVIWLWGSLLTTLTGEPSTAALRMLESVLGRHFQSSDKLFTFDCVSKVITSASASGPIIFILDEIERFARYPNFQQQASQQSLLYTLFDLSRTQPVVVLGLSQKPGGDLVEMLEKRVRSRFSQNLIYLGRSMTEDRIMKVKKRPLPALGLPSVYLLGLLRRVRLKAPPGSTINLDLLYREYASMPAASANCTTASADWTRCWPRVMFRLALEELEAEGLVIVQHGRSINALDYVYCPIQPRIHLLDLGGLLQASPVSPEWPEQLIQLCQETF